MCENSDHYRQWLWVGLVDQQESEILPFCFTNMYDVEGYLNLGALTYAKFKSTLSFTEWVQPILIPNLYRVFPPNYQQET